MEIDFEIQYTECSLAAKGVEEQPILRTYYDSHLIRSEAGGGIITTQLDENDLTKVYEGTLKADAIVGNALLETAAIGFASYAKRRNEFDVQCYTNAGTAAIRIGDILHAHRRRKEYAIELPLLMETTRIMGDPVEKGKILFRVKAIRIPPAVKIVPAAATILGAPVDAISEELNQFIQERVAFEGQMEDTWEGIKNVRVPMDISSAGIQSTRDCFVPVEGFVMSEPLVTNEGYYQNAFERVMHRRNMSVSADFKAMDKIHKAEVMAEICTYAAENFEYISDTVDRSSRKTDATYMGGMRVGFEDFNNMGTTWSGDCEDGAKLIQDQFNGFMRMKPESIKSAELRELRTIASNYIYFLTLATVHGAKADDGEAEHVGAHMYGLLLPKRQVRAALQVTPQGRELAERFALVSEEGLPTLFCEGTGQIRPLGPGPMIVTPTSHLVQALHPEYAGSYDPLIKERRMVGMLRSKQGTKTLIPQNAGGRSGFYLGNLTLVCDYFINTYGYPLGTFLCARDDGQGKLTRGSMFTDVINQRPSFTMIPFQPMTERIMQITREASMLRAPPRPFLFDAKKPLASPAIHPEWERVKKHTASLKRVGSSPFGPVDVCFRPHTFNKSRIDRMIQEISKMPAIYKVDYVVDGITNEVNTYRVRFYVDRAQV